MSRSSSDRHWLLRSRSDRVFDALNILFMILFCIVIIYPIYYCLVLSFNDGIDTESGGLTFWPRVFTLDNYAEVFKEGTVFRAFSVSIARTLVGTLASLLFNSLVSFGLVKKDLIGRKGYITLFIITMYFSGGTIPIYMLVKDLGLLNSFWAFILPSLSGFPTILLYMAFFREIPSALIESARIDGAGYYRVFFQLVIPLSTPLLATMALFAGVGQWNSWYDGYIYMTKREDLMTLTTYLVRLLNAEQAKELLRRTGKAGVSGDMYGGITSDSLKVATMFIAMAPIAMVYPFLQKYFIKGIMLGAVKG